MPLEKEEIKEFFEYAILIPTTIIGIFVGLGFLFIGLINKNFPFVIVGLFLMLSGLISASVLSIKQIKNERRRP